MSLLGTISCRRLEAEYLEMCYEKKMHSCSIRYFPLVMYIALATERKDTWGGLIWPAVAGFMY